ncbi:MAG: ATP-dependent Clp protease ATP-binding subunit [Deltaproteobacteria bacterium]|nr:ATP-dependent Clp protease ATP-binding subunit [Deltaproteobacteria bacterium]
MRGDEFVVATSAARLVAGMSALGQWQERIRRVVEAASELDAILYLDALGDLLADRASSGTDLVAALRGPVEQAKIRIVGEITPEVLGLFESRHAGFLGSFTRVQVPALPASIATEVVRSRLEWSRVHEPERPSLDEGAIRTLVDLAGRYLPYQSFPGKAVRLLDETRDEHAAARGGAGSRLGSADVSTAFAVRTGLPAFLVREDRPLRVEDVIAHFGRRVRGQDRAIRAVAETLCVAKAGLSPPGKPLATFLFVGPTGVGKTEVARTLATYLFGSPDRLVRFDMSEHTDPWAAERLVRGHDGGDGILTRRVRQRPFCVLLLDEVEKAHPSVHDLLLQLCGEGRLTDGRGRTTWFHDTLVILTSNVGAAHRTSRVSFDDTVADEGDEHWLEAVRRTFRPELVNRFDRIVPFQPLSPADLRRVVETLVGNLSDRRGALERRLALDVSAEALDWLATRGSSDRYGARALRRTVEDEVVAPAARLLATLPDPTGVHLRIDVDASEGSAASGGGNRLRVEVASRATATARRAISSAAISDLRREAGKLARLERVQSVRSETDYLVAQLAGVPSRGAGAELERLRTEHHRRDRAIRALNESADELDTIEEMAVVAALDMEDASPLVSDAEQAFRGFRSALLEVLVVAAPVRDEITICVSELDGADTFSRWLVPLLSVAEERRWSLVAHGLGVKATRDDDWRSPNRWGPPRPPDWLLGELEKTERPFKHLLLRAKGPYAGVLLSLEAGIHRWTNVVAGHEHAHLRVTRMAMRTELTPEEWARESMGVPASPGSRAQLALLPAVRLHDGDTAMLSIANGRRRLSIAADDYWGRFEDVALEHLLLYEHEEDGRGMDRDELFAGSLELSPVEDEER